MPEEEEASAAGHDYVKTVDSMDVEVVCPEIEPPAESTDNTSCCCACCACCCCECCPFRRTVLKVVASAILTLVVINLACGRSMVDPWGVLAAMVSGIVLLGVTLEMLYYKYVSSREGDASWRVCICDAITWKLGKRDAQQLACLLVTYAIFALLANIIDDSAGLYQHVSKAFNNTPPILMAHSLGTGPAVALATEVVPACVTLFCPFTTMRQVALETLFFTVMAWIWVVDPWRSIDRIQRMKSSNISLAVVSAGNDMVIHPHLHQEMYKKASSHAKILFSTPGAGHNSIATMIAPHKVKYGQFISQCIRHQHL